MKSETFYINKFSIIKTDTDIDLLEIPSSIRRRLSKIDKVALSLFFRIYDESIDEIVFASTYGELDRLESIIEQYQTYNEVSPTQFSGSVHNYPVGCLCQLKQTNIPYNSIASDSNSISAGLIKSIISENKNILFCYSDYTDTPKGIGCLISKERIYPNAIKCVIEQMHNKEFYDEFINLCNFLSEEKASFNSGLCKITRS